MTTRWLWVLRRIARQTWFRASLFSVAAVATALLAIVVSPYIPRDLPTQIGADAVDNILGIIAASMLTVTTFSLSTMVAAYSAATSNVTPRATQLIMEDATTQNVLATFIGSFLFSLVGIITLSTGAYGGRVVLFAVTIVVIGLIVVTLLRWIDHLSKLGRVTETTQRIEDVTVAAMRERRDHPYFDSRVLSDPEREIPSDAWPVFPSQIGYVQHLDAAALSKLAGAGPGDIYVLAIPGDLVNPTEPIARVFGLDPDAATGIRECFTVAQTRSFDQDPRFGASVLTEIASRALSPAVNDPGTAIDVIGRSLRILSVWAQPPQGGIVVRHSNVFVPALALADLFDDLYAPIARDGASLVEIGIRLQKAFRILSRLEPAGFSQNARRHALLALERCERALAIEDDKRRLREAAAWARDEP